MIVLWDVLDRILDRAAGLDDLRAHRLQLLAAQRLRARGQELPPGLADEERRASVTALVAAEVLTAIRNAATEPFVVFKGPEIASLYPHPSTRSFTDLDVLTERPVEMHRALRAGGFEEVGDPRLYEGIHHLRPLALPHLPLPVEIHSRAKWVDWHRGLHAADVVRQAVPGSMGVDGISAPAPEHHTLILAAHSWAHEPLRRIADLLDVGASAERSDGAVVAELAERWGLGAVWRTTRRVIDALAAGETTPPPGLGWARSVFEVRERTVFESHLESWLSPYAARPPLRAFGDMARAILLDVRRDSGEPWARKLRRSSHAVAASGRPRSEHDRMLERIGADAGRQS